MLRCDSTNRWMLAIAALCTAPSAPAQIHSLWERSSPPGVAQSFAACATDSSGRVVAAGRTNVGSTSRGYVARFTPAGVLTLSLTHGASLSDQFSDVAVGPGDVITTVGTSLWPPPISPAQQTRFDAWSASGALLDQRILQSPLTPSSIVAPIAGEVRFAGWNVAVTRYQVGSGPVATNGWAGANLGQRSLHVDALQDTYVAALLSTGVHVRKVLPSGAEAWTSVSLGNSTQLPAIASDSGGFLYVSSGRLPPSGPADMALTKLDPATGTIVWQRTHDGGMNQLDYATGVRVGPQDDVYLAGARTPTGQSTTELVVLRYDTSGTLLGSGSHAGLGTINEGATGVVTAPDGGVWVWGHADSVGGPGLVVLRFDQSLTARSTYSRLHGGPMLAFADADVGPGRSLYVAGGSSSTSVVLRVGTNGFPYCFGDGTGTPCPCGNASAIGDDAGCLNSLGRGATLREGGFASLSNDDFELHGAGMTNSFAIYFQGTTAEAGGAGTMLGDGLLCAGGTLVRLGSKLNSAGSSTYPEPGDASISVRGSIGVPGTRTYQIFYRNAAAFCLPASFNTSSALNVTWEP